MLNLSRAALLAASLSLAVPAAFVVVPAYAQETQAPVFELKIPSVVAVDSSMSEDQIKDVFTSKFLSQADALARLTASSITIPEISLTFDADGATGMPASVVTYRDIVLTNVSDGFAEKLSIGSGESNSQGETAVYKTITIDQFDLKRLLELTGIVKGDAGAPLSAVFTAATANGGSQTGPLYSCTFGPSTTAALEARPAKVPFSDVLAVIEKYSAADEPPPEALSTIVSWATDIFRAVRGGAGTVGAIDCTIPGEMPVSIKVGGATTSGFEPGIYPEFKVMGIAVDAGPMGNGSLGEFALKPIDFTGTLEALDSAAGELSEAWMEANWRRLIPAFGGFSLSNFAVDTINPDKPDERIAAKIGGFDLSLGSYFNGIPTDVSASLQGVEVPLPQDTTDPQMAMLLAFGLTNINMSADVAASWDQNASSIALEKVALSLADLGSMSMSADLGNATDKLFDADPNVAMVASMGLTVKQLVISVTDEGMGELAWPIMAAQEGISDVEAYRTQLAGTFEGLPVQMLGSTDQARALGVALGDFIAGRKASLTITVTSKDPNGIPLPLFQAASEDPSVLVGQVDVVGTAS